MNRWSLAAVCLLAGGLATGYFVFVYRNFAGKVSLEKDAHTRG